MFYLLIQTTSQKKTAVERGIKLLREFDMLWFYERSWKPKRLLEILYEHYIVLKKCISELHKKINNEYKR